MSACSTETKLKFSSAMSEFGKEVMSRLVGVATGRLRVMVTDWPPPEVELVIVVRGGVLVGTGEEG